MRLTDYRSEVIVADQTSGTILNKYDVFSRWAGQTCPALGGAGPYEITVVNGAGGLPESLTSVGGTINYAYDSAWRVSSISSPANTFNYSYNPSNGLVAGVAGASGASAAFTYDQLDRLKQTEWTSGTNIVRKYDYDYNVVGMITQKVTAIGGQMTTNAYAYDGLDRLISESSFSPQTSAVSLFMYDLVGNRTQMVQNGQTIRYTLSAGNRLTSWGVDSTNSLMKYDNAGNVTSIYYSASNQVILKWDSRYRVTAVATNGTTAESYGYDALDRRISISDGITTNYMVYNGPHVIAEVGTSGSFVRSYTYGPGIDNILSMTVHGATTNTYYYIKDHLGSVQALTDTNGVIVESYQYDAWGNVLNVFDSSGSPIENRQSQIGNRFCWQGREYSWKTGFYYFRARWYEPVTGRWLSNDPIGISGGLNQYVFCGDNPVNFRDPLGLLTEQERPEIQDEIRHIDAVLEALRSGKSAESVAWPGGTSYGGYTRPLPFGFSWTTIGIIRNQYIRQAVEKHERVHRRQWQEMYRRRWSKGILKGLSPMEWYFPRLIEFRMEVGYEIEAYGVSKKYLEDVLTDNPFFPSGGW